MPNVKIVERRDINVILKILNEENDKIIHSVISYNKKRGEEKVGEEGLPVA